MLSPAEIIESSTKIGINKTKMPALKTLVLGVFAGMFIAFAGTAATFGNVYVGKIAGACIFPAGLAMVLVAGSELFTGNNLMIIPLLKKKITLKQLLRNWGLVLLGNFIGSLLVVIMVVLSGVLDPIAESVISTANAKINLGFCEAMLRGILCNILICIAVWMSFAADTVAGKIIAIFFPVMIFVLCGFEHSIANMFYIPAGILEAVRTGASSISFIEFITSNLIPVVIGNIIGGSLIVGGGYYIAYCKEKQKKAR